MKLPSQQNLWNETARETTTKPTLHCQDDK